LKNRVNIGGYPVQEMGGLIFAYLGEGTPPILPPWDVLVYKNALRQIGHAVIPCNWLQCQENASDPAHSVYLHGHFFKYILEREGLMEDRASDPTTHRSWTSINGVKGFDHVISKRDAHGVQKAMVYTPERGAERYQERWHSYMIFPNIARVGGAGLRYEMQFRVPIDDTHTSHFVLDIYCAPEGVEFNQPLPVPHYTLPIEDEEGNPILDYILSQDMVAWWSQGEITDRSREHLGATDLAIIDFRNMLDEQIAVVENGGNPINFYRHEDEVGETIECTPRIMSDEYRGPSWGGSRAAMHRGFWRDDADRYGPIIHDAIDLMRRAEEHRAVQS
jgi:5,5'-dehydrodivanillate O-demethylase